MLTQEEFEKLGIFYLGRKADDSKEPVLYDSRDLVTHAVCVGMTGSGKTGLCIGLLEEAVLDGIPAIVIDPKGDIGNLMLTFPDLAPSDFLPWIDADEARRKETTVERLAEQKAKLWRDGLESWGQSAERIARLKSKAEVSIYTPGSTAGLPVSMLSSLEAPDEKLRRDLEMMTDRVSGTVTSILGLLGIEGDPLQTPEHIFVSNVVTHYWNQGVSLDLAGLIAAIQNPPISKIGVMDLETIYPEKKRTALAMKINNLIAAPAFASWLDGAALDVQKFLWTEEGKPRVSIFSISHLPDRERMFFVSLLLNQVLGWMRGQSGTTSLRALVYMDEIFGYLPPVAEPPSKKPLLTLLKQARAYGLGLVLATQNPADLDYKALSNTGTWFLGRLQTERDRDRVLDGLMSAGGSFDKKSLSATLTGLESRRFLLHNVHEPEPIVFKTRWVLSYLKGPLTREDIRTLMHEQNLAAKPEPAASSTDKLKAVPTQPITKSSPVGAVRTKPPVGERFMAIGLGAPSPDARLLYRPMIYGWGNAAFIDDKRDIHQDIRFGLIHGIQASQEHIEWAKAFRVDLDPADFDATPDATHGAIEYMELCNAAKTKTSYTRWKRELVDFVYRNETIDSWACLSQRLKSEGTENGAAFAARVSEHLRQKRDDEVDKIRDKYNKKMKTAEEKMRRAEDAVETQQDQARDSMISAGTSILGMMFGRKSARSVTSGARRVSKTAKEKRDVERAERKFQDAQNAYLELDLELQNALAGVAEKYSPENYPIELVPMKPKKKNIAVDLFEVVWVPYWVGTDGEKQLAVSY